MLMICLCNGNFLHSIAKAIAQVFTKENRFNATVSLYHENEAVYLYSTNGKFTSKIYNFSLLIKVYGLKTGADDIFMTWYVFPLVVACYNIALN